MSALIVALIVSFTANLALLRFKHLHQKFSYDNNPGIQKVHVGLVPRIGGLGILLGATLSLLIRGFRDAEVGVFGLTLLGCALPVFLSGFIEDLTKKVSVLARLTFAVVSCVLAGFFLGAWLTSLQILGVDRLMESFPLVAIFITCFAVTGVVNSFNIIDGYNGISGVVSFMSLAGLAYVAFVLNDHQILVCSLVMMGAILGFVALNYPLGLLFLGDGGAYLLGFWVAELSVLLTLRNPEVSKWFPFLLCFYPIWELMFTVYRRLVFSKMRITLPDASHLHHLIYLNILAWLKCDVENTHKQISNSLTAPYLWSLSAVVVLPAVLFWDNVWMLRGFAIFFIFLYLGIYFNLLRKLR